jgi:hypothetical protein
MAADIIEVLGWQGGLAVSRRTVTMMCWATSVAVVEVLRQ